MLNKPNVKKNPVGEQNVKSLNQSLELAPDCLHKNILYGCVWFSISLARLLRTGTSIVKTLCDVYSVLALLRLSLWHEKLTIILIHQIIFNTLTYTQTYTHLHLHTHHYTQICAKIFIDIQYRFLVFTEWLKTETLLQFSPIYG